MGERKMSTNITLSQLYVFPVKSLRGLSPSSWGLDARGLQNDRRYMLVDEQGRFLTQRQQHRMALIDVHWQDGRLRLSAEGKEPIEVPVLEDAAQLRAVEIWGEQQQGFDQGDVVASWLAEFLGVTCRMVRHDLNSPRAVDADYARPGDVVSFSDGFPFLVLSEASVAALSKQAGVELDIRRFRPNLVIRGCEPFEEDQWRRIRIGQSEFELVKPCSRCIIPTIDPNTGERGPEPMRALMATRRRENKVYLGQNAIQRSAGESLAVGDGVEVLEWL